MQVFSSSQGWLIIVSYFAMVMVLAYLYSYRDKIRTKLSFLVANRTVSGWPAAFSIAATWIWAPALFIASEKAFTQGIAGVFWFTVPNILCLAVFGFFATRMRNMVPEGWTFSDHIRTSYSNRTHNLYLVESFGLQICSFAVQLLAGGAILHKLTGIPFFWTTLAMAVIPFVYTYLRGIKASIMTDLWQMAWIILVLVLILPPILGHSGDLVKGLGGSSGTFDNLFGKTGWLVFLSFGIPATVGLFSGPFGDQMFWQRVWSIKKKDVKKSFLHASWIFGIVPIVLSTLGFIYAGSGAVNVDTQLTNVQGLMMITPSRLILVLFMFMILSGLISTCDSVICAVSSVVGHDIAVRIQERNINRKVKPVVIARMAMVLVTILAICIANIPGIKILYLWLLYGTLRSSVLLPTIYAILKIRMSEKGLFYGILISIVLGVPMFAIGKFGNHLPWILAGTFTTLLASGIISRLKFKT